MRKYLLFLILIFCCFGFTIQDAHKAVIARKNASTACSLTAQDFTSGYSETDPNNELAITDADTVTATLLDKNHTAFIIKDFTAGYFGVDFTIRFRLYITLWNDYSVVCVGMSNDNTKDLYTIDNTDSGDYQAFCIKSGAADDEFDVRVCENGTINSDTSAIDPALSTYYYITWTRDDDGGANSTGRHTAYICSTGFCTSGGNLLDTLTVDSAAGEQNDFRYFYAISSMNNGADYNYISGLVEIAEVGACID